MNIKALRAKGKTLEPAINIGKAGITKGMLAEVGRQLKKQKLLKIKLLKSFVDQHDKKKAAEELAFRLRAVVIQQIGNVIVLAKKETDSSEKEQII
ncbi:MAG: YhbY family RNA-binding protein [Candidatus Woesearchaeota archaeon]